MGKASRILYERQREQVCLAPLEFMSMLLGAWLRSLNIKPMSFVKTCEISEGNVLTISGI